MSKISVLPPLALILCNVALVLAYCHPKDCVDLKCYGLSRAADGPHVIYPTTTHPKTMQVSCDQTKSGGGWIATQRRSSERHAVRFDGRFWDEYKNGFGENGDETTELWLGNENTYQLLQMYKALKWDLLVEGYAESGRICTFTAEGFRMENESRKYSIVFEIGFGCQKTSFYTLIHKPFRTVDNRGHASGKDFCFNTYAAGWWYSTAGVGVKCHSVFLNGRHHDRDTITDDSIYIQSFDRGRPLKGSVMLIRPSDATSRICVNPCANKPNSVCKYSPALKAHHCICPPLKCGSDCKQTCEHGGVCKFNVASDVNECKCTAGFNGPLCADVATTIILSMATTTQDAGTTTSEPETESGALVAVMLITSLLMLLAAAGAAYYIILQRRRRQKEEEAAQEERGKLLLKDNTNDTMLAWVEDMFVY